MVHLPMTRNQVAENIQTEMMNRVLITKKKAEEEVKNIDQEARRRATETTDSMVLTIKTMRIERDHLKEERTKHEEILKNSLRSKMITLKKRHQDMNVTLTQTMKERTILQQKAEEQDNKLEEKRKRHMFELNKMRRSEMKLEDDLRLQNLQDEGK